MIAISQVIQHITEFNDRHATLEHSNTHELETFFYKLLRVSILNLQFIYCGEQVSSEYFCSKVKL